MKKWLFILLTALMLVAALTLTACNGDDPSETDSDTTSDSVSDSESVSDSGSASDTDSETESETEYDDPDLILDHLTIGGLDISNYTVVVSATPATYDEQAADFIIRFVKEATGVTLNKITDAETAAHEIVVGITNRDTEDMAARRAKIENDGYVMAVKDGNLYIQADIPRGTLFGVYDFLEDYVGVQLYGYDRYYQKEVYEIQAHVRVDVPADLSVDYDSVFMQRHSGWSSASRGAWAYPLWCTYNASEVPYPGCHTIDKLSETYTGKSPCLSDDTVYQTVLKNVRAQLAADPNLLYVSVTQVDGKENTRCTCQKCLAVEKEEGSASALWINFVNRIAEDIEEDYPNVYIETFAYNYTVEPPKTVRPRENVTIRLCTMDTCNLHALNDPDCAQNVKFMEQLQKWSEICDHLMIWTYAANYANSAGEADIGSGSSIGPNIRVILQNARVFADYNVKSVFTEGKIGNRTPSFEFGELRGYLWGKAMWDPYMSEEEFEGYINDFMAYYYGDAAPLILQYLDALNEMAGTVDDNFDWGSGHSGTYVDNELFFHLTDKDGVKHVEFCDEMRALWDQIDALDTLTEEQRAHVDQAGYHFYDYCRIVYQDQLKLRSKYTQKCNAILRKFTPSA